MTHLHQTPAFTFDPIEAAEAMGYSGENVGNAALAMTIANSQLRRSMAVDAGDTLFNDDMSRARGIVERCGFKLVGQYTVKRKSACKDCHDVVEIYAHEKLPCIATLESYDGSQVNTSHTYFVAPWADRRRTDHLGYSGAYESQSTPNWRQSFRDVNDVPSDLVLVGKYHSLECFASKFNQLKECTLVQRPEDTAFSIVEDVFLTNEDYQSEGRDEDFAQKAARLQALALERLSQTGLTVALFGGPPQKLQGTQD